MPSTIAMRWALHALLIWRNDEKPEALVRIHGTQDRLLPCRHADIAIAGGGHFMVVNRAAECSEILRRSMGCRSGANQIHSELACKLERNPAMNWRREGACALRGRIVIVEQVLHNEIY
ncbi:MAG: hypothetical protein LBO00_02830, partial [Zoogloeaceae bacterium]|nr:hypothetical protein [Zoogloeaceae bacterium]